MRPRETHFEQVPIAIVEAVLDETTASGTVKKKSPGQIPARKFPPPAANPKQNGDTPSKGRQ